MTRLLIIGASGQYETKRIITAARQSGIEAAAASFRDIVIEGHGDRVLVKGKDLKFFNVLYFRGFWPYVSEALIIADAMRRHGGRVVDTSLAERPYIMSKTFETRALKRAGLSVPRTIQCFETKRFEAALKSFQFPLIVKGVHGGLGEHVYLAKNPRQVREIVKHNRRGFYSLQEYIPAREDIRVITLGYRALGAMRRRVPAGGFRANLAQGGRPEKIELTPQIKKTAERAARALGREFGGVDIILKNRRPYVLEVNQTPGFKGFEKVTGIDVAAAFINYLKTPRVQGGVKGW
jgi:RimK family alpha-L-glutamate ligase